MSLSGRNSSWSWYKLIDKLQCRHGCIIRILNEGNELPNSSRWIIRSYSNAEAVLWFGVVCKLVGRPNWFPLSSSCPFWTWKVEWIPNEGSKSIKRNVHLLRNCIFFDLIDNWNVNDTSLSFTIPLHRLPTCHSKSTVRYWFKFLAIHLPVSSISLFNFTKYFIHSFIFIFNFIYWLIHYSLIIIN